MKRIAITDIQPGMILARDVLSRNGQHLLKPGVRLSPEYIKRLAEYGIPTVYIGEPDPLDSLDVKALYEGVRELPDIISFETRLLAEKAVCKMMNDAKSGLIIEVQEAKDLVDRMLNEILQNRNVIAKLSDIRILDDYTFAHSVNVCVLSLATGLIFELSRNDLRELGIGALLHDIGKVVVGEEIIKKPGLLNTQEFAEIQKHPSHGYNILRRVPDISLNAATIALQHHERYNGEGYPYGLTAKDIHKYSQIVAIADSYDAMTANRVYKNMVLPYEAIEVIIASSGYYFDPEIVQCFVENTAIYPIGSEVQLSDDSIGVVVKINRSLPIRPTIRLLKDSQGNPVKESTEIDLMQQTTLFINKILKFRSVR